MRGNTIKVQLLNNRQSNTIQIQYKTIQKQNYIYEERICRLEGCCLTVSVITYTT